MPAPNPGLKVDAANQKFKFLMIFSQPKTGYFGKFRNVLGQLTITNPPDGSCALGVMQSETQTSQAIFKRIPRGPPRLHLYLFERHGLQKRCSFRSACPKTHECNTRVIGAGSG